MSHLKRSPSPGPGTPSLTPSSPQDLEASPAPTSLEEDLADSLDDLFDQIEALVLDLVLDSVVAPSVVPVLKRCVAMLEDLSSQGSSPQ